MPYQSKICGSEEAVVPKFCKITEPRKQKLEVEMFT